MRGALGFYLSAGEREKMFRHLIKTIISVAIVILVGHSSAFSAASTDISMIGLGARPMGMGKAFTALADDTSAMYLNPAGLAQLKRPQLLSMQSSLLNDINYLTIAGNTPFGPGTLGLSLLQSSVDGINLTELDSNDRPRTTDTVTYLESVWYLSYGLRIDEQMDRNFNWHIRGKLYGGVSYKYFHKGVSGIAEAGGSNGDIGLLYQPDAAWSYGLALKNFIHSQDGIGSMSWDTGAHDSMVSYTTFGLAYKYNEKFRVLSDYDFSFTDKRKALLHIGTEYYFDDYVAVRLGWEQLHDSIGAETKDHITFGLSLLVNGFTIDYAYQPYYGMAENTTHFISFGYTFDTPQAPVYTFDPEEGKMADEHVPTLDAWVLFEQNRSGAEEQGGVPETAEEDRKTDGPAALELISEAERDHFSEQELCLAYELAAKKVSDHLADRTNEGPFTLEQETAEGYANAY